MTATDLGSTVPRRQLGRYLRKLREDGQITIKAASDALEWSPQKIWRIENGAVAMRSHDVETMCRVYGAPASLTQALTALARETRSKGWWHSYGHSVPSWFGLYMGLESAASRLRHYEPELVPGLLQTKAYTLEVIDVNNPTAENDERERLATVRLQRQGLLTRRLPDPPQLDVILSESVLRRPLRDRPAMAGQLDHLTQVGERPNVSIRILPMSAGLHPATTAGAFVILDFPVNGNREPEPSTVYSEGVTGALYLDKLSEVEAYATVWAGLEAMSLDSEQSTVMIKAVAEEYAS